MAKQKSALKSRYEYNIGVVTRSCGHTEDLGVVTSSYAHEPTVREWKQNEKCSECKGIEADERDRKTEAFRQKAQTFLDFHGIEGHISAYPDSAEIIIYIK